MSIRRIAKYLGFDISTTAVSAGVRDAEGNEGFAAIPIRGATTWHGQPAFDPTDLPIIIWEALQQLIANGWAFSDPGHMCASVRQHDMVLVGESGEPLVPLITWQCHAATEQVDMLRSLGAEAEVGRIEPRFILAKLMWAIKQNPSLIFYIKRVMTTGDFFAWKLTGEQFLSTSDALSNGLLNQGTKRLAVKTIRAAGLNLGWFPLPVQSGQIVGRVEVTPAGSVWRDVTNILKGWTVRAGLGDNHAGGVGSGLADPNTIVISLGSSGTVIRMCRPGIDLAGNAANFEYFDNRLLLMMLADCAVWYDRFANSFNPDHLPHSDLDRFALNAVRPDLRYVTQKAQAGGWAEVYPDDWQGLSLPVKVTSTQASIAVHMLRLVRDMLGEVQIYSEGINRFVLTGGLSRSPFLQHVLATGLNMLKPNSDVLVSGRTGPLANKAAVLGALFTAMANTPEYPSLAAVIDDLCTLQPVAPLSLDADFGEGNITAFISVNL